jgi:8-oxo-dGTP diphosphatase
MGGQATRALIRKEIDCIVPVDVTETAHLSDALAWVDSGAELFRIEKPARPPKHLVSYVAVIRGENILLVDHKNAQLWLPPGGHVEQHEHPRATAQRELKEEMGISALHEIGAPLFLTCTETVGLTRGHVDVSLWYVVTADSRQQLVYDDSEFGSARWFSFDQIPVGRTDPHLLRFLGKLRQVTHDAGPRIA